jgi:hypothetical protein
MPLIDEVIGTARQMAEQLTVDPDPALPVKQCLQVQQARRGQAAGTTGS